MTSSSQSTHEEQREKYGVLNPAGHLMCSKALERELRRIVDTSRASGWRVGRCGPGEEVTVELTFEPDDFPELWPWSGWESEDDNQTVPVETVEDSLGNEKKMIGRPAGLKDADIPTGDSDLDWQCPKCGEVGNFRRISYPNPSCTTRGCRVDKYSPHVREVNEDD